MKGVIRRSFLDFTRHNYRRLVRLAKSKYTFATYPEFRMGRRMVLWRHDVDFSLQSALALARIEAEEGVRATYFLLPHSDFYNLLDAESRSTVKAILAFGHDIGLHFDAAFHGVASASQMHAALRLEQQLLRTVFNAPVRVFSFHNPTPALLKFTDARYAGLINTYASRFMRQVGYCSDSNGYWRHRRLEDVLRDGTDESLQVLTHPGWWQAVPMPPRARVWRCVDGRAAFTKRNYARQLRAFGRKNVK